MFSYARFSSDRQSNGDSLRRQTALRDGWMARHPECRLDTAFKLTDLGVSAFHGANALTGNLSIFMEAVRRGTIPAGSILLIESLDRISRQGIDEGYEVVKSILKANVRIVTLMPEREFGAEAVRSLSKGALEIQLILERAAEESETKSKRVGAAWQARLKRARETGEPVTNSVPAWLALVGGKYQPIPDRVKTIREIFRLAASGYGHYAVVKKLTRDGVPGFGPSGKWSRFYVGCLLRDERVRGVFTPHKRADGGKKRIKAGKPINGFYPEIISEAEWLAVRGEVDSRRRPSGDALGYVSLFGGLLTCARDGTTFVDGKSKRRNSVIDRVFRNHGGIEGTDKYVTFPVRVFEECVLELMREIDPNELAGSPQPKPDHLATVAGELATVEAELREANEFMGAEGFSPTIGKRIVTLEARQGELAAEVGKLRAQTLHPLAERWGEFKSLVDYLEKAKDKTDARIKLRAALGRIVESAYLLPVKAGAYRPAAVQFFFHGGAARSFLIAYQPAHGNSGRPACWSARSFAGAHMPGSLDLRRPDHAAKVERLLQRMQLS